MLVEEKLFDAEINYSDDILSEISLIQASEEIEKNHIQDTIDWIKSGAELCRLKKPDIPNKHLVSYFLLFDEEAKKILLVDHINACMWLPTGGHVEPREHPKETARRECLEELGVSAEFWTEQPVFLTQSVTVGLTPGHTNVCLWYILKGDSKASYIYDKSEFHTIEWFDLDAPPDNAEEHLSRFMSKFKNIL